MRINGRRISIGRTPTTITDSGWRAMVGDETDDEINDPSNVLLQNLGYLIDRWPELRPVFKTEPRNGSWIWDAIQSKYVQDLSLIHI